MSWFVEHVHRDGSVLARVAVQGDALRIGRALDNDLILDDAHCAAHHACLRIQADGRAVMEDLGSVNGIALHPGKPAGSITITGEQPLRLGQSLLRVRSSDWPLAAEKPLSSRLVWPWALLALLAVLGNNAWEVWLSDLSDKSPPYLYALSSVAAIFGIWSAGYALFGRLIGGVDRFFSHLLIACCGYLCSQAIHAGLASLAFSAGWLWPLQIAPYVLIVVVALVVRQHLRLADPRHWPATRWGVLLVAVCAFLVPLGQTWMSQQRLTDIQTMEEIAHPRWRLARPVPVGDFSDRSALLQQRVDAARVEPTDENLWWVGSED
jgi:hypothetical protein